MRLSLSPDTARALNLIGMLGMVGVLLGAYVYQFTYHELPCTLCMLQRVAMIGVAFGAAMNVMLGPDPRHYGVCLVSAVFGGVISIRQSLLHINPFFDTKTGLPTMDAGSNPPFGEAVFGYHLYIWGLVLFAFVILAVGIVQLFGGQFERREVTSGALMRLGALGVGLLFLTVAAEAATTFMECGIGDCPNDGGWNWWIFR
ncbi:MAG: disulfide bond formation protein B [Salaquimonas sp.]|nr:disulfide bond formation protein B [Salaquimonas sp.]